MGRRGFGLQLLSLRVVSLPPRKVRFYYYPTARLSRDTRAHRRDDVWTDSGGAVRSLVGPGASASGVTVRTVDRGVGAVPRARGHATRRPGPCVSADGCAAHARRPGVDRHPAVPGSQVLRESRVPVDTDLILPVNERIMSRVTRTCNSVACSTETLHSGRSSF